MTTTVIGKVQARVVSVKRPNFTGEVVEHHHGDGKWHWAQDVHTTKHRTKHEDVEGIGKPSWVGKADAPAYRVALAGKERTPIRTQKAATPEAPKAEDVIAQAEALVKAQYEAVLDFMGPRA